MQDELWKADHRETDAEIDARLKLALDVIFSRLLDLDDTCKSRLNQVLSSNLSFCSFLYHCA